MSSGGEVTGCSLSPMKPQRSAGSRTGTGHSRHFPPSGGAVLPTAPTGGRAPFPDAAHPLFPDAVPGCCSGRWPAGSREALAVPARRPPVPRSRSSAPVFRAVVPGRRPVVRSALRPGATGRNSTGGWKPPRGAGVAGEGRGRGADGVRAGCGRGADGVGPRWRNRPGFTGGPVGPAVAAPGGCRGGPAAPGGAGAPGEGCGRGAAGPGPPTGSASPVGRSLRVRAAAGRSGALRDAARTAAGAGRRRVVGEGSSPAAGPHDPRKHDSRPPRTGSG